LSDSANIYLTDITTSTSEAATTVNVLGSSNTQDVDIYHGGDGIHLTELRLGGAQNVVLIAQEGSGTTDVDIDSDGGTANINAYMGTPGTIDLELNGAGVDVDITILP